MTLDVAAFGRACSRSGIRKAGQSNAPQGGGAVSNRAAVTDHTIGTTGTISRPVETTKNIYGHLFATDRASILDAMNQAVSRLSVYDGDDKDDTKGQAA